MFGKKKYPFSFSNGGDEPVDVYAGPPFEVEPDDEMTDESAEEETDEKR